MKTPAVQAPCPTDATGPGLSSACYVPREAAECCLVCGLKMKLRTGDKPRKQTSKRAGIGQASASTRTKNGLNGSSINAHFKKKGFYSVYTLSAEFMGKKNSVICLAYVRALVWSCYKVTVHAAVQPRLRDTSRVIEPRANVADVRFRTKHPSG